MGRTRWSLAAAGALAVLGAGCSSDPLVGTWATSFTYLGTTGTSTYQVNGDGTLAYTLSGSGSTCSGSMTWSGYTWTSTGTSVAFAGVPQCSGSFTCGAFSLNCTAGSSQALKAGSCSYALSNNDDTLALTSCSGTSDVTLTREN